MGGDPTYDDWYPSTPYLDILGASQNIGISVTTLYKLVSQQRIPHIKMGGLLKFDPLKLDEWIRRQTIMPMPRR